MTSHTLCDTCRNSPRNCSTALTASTSSSTREMMGHSVVQSKARCATVLAPRHFATLQNREQTIKMFVAKLREGMELQLWLGRASEQKQDQDLHCSRIERMKVCGQGCQGPQHLSRKFECVNGPSNIIHSRIPFYHDAYSLYMELPGIEKSKIMLVPL